MYLIVHKIPTKSSQNINTISSDKLGYYLGSFYIFILLRRFPTLTLAVHCTIILYTTRDGIVLTGYTILYMCYIYITVTQTIHCYAVFYGIVPDYLVYITYWTPLV